MYAKSARMNIHLNQTLINIKVFKRLSLSIIIKMNDDEITIDELILPSVTFYGCNHCQNYFKSKSSRSRHIREYHPDKLMIHTKRESYPCVYANCNHTSKSRSSKRGHEIKVHEKTFGCIICDKYFCNNNSLKNHSKRFHSDTHCMMCNIPLFDEKKYEEHLYKDHQS